MWRSGTARSGIEDVGTGDAVGADGTDGVDGAAGGGFEGVGDEGSVMVGGAVFASGGSSAGAGARARASGVAEGGLGEGSGECERCGDGVVARLGVTGGGAVRPE